MYWDKLRKFQPDGPLVNSEYYPGWLTHWQEKMQRVDTKTIAATFRFFFLLKSNRTGTNFDFIIFRQMLARNASVNFYMFFGGSNFGFTAGK